MQSDTDPKSGKRTLTAWGLCALLMAGVIGIVLYHDSSMRRATAELRSARQREADLARTIGSLESQAADLEISLRRFKELARKMYPEVPEPVAISNSFRRLEWLSRQPKEEDDIREAIVRWEIQHDDNRKQFGTIYFIALGEQGSDPPDEFMKRFSNEEPAVRRRSDSTNETRTVAVDKKNMVRMNQLVDKETGHPGRIISVSRILWKSEDEVEADGVWYEGPVSARGKVYTLRKVNGKWQVTKDHTKLFA